MSVYTIRARGFNKHYTMKVKADSREEAERIAKGAARQMEAHGTKPKPPNRR